jgi:dolichol kinase
VTVLHVDARDLAQEVFFLLQSLDPSRLRDELRESARQQAERLAAEVRRLASDESGAPFASVAEVLEQAPEVPGDWETFRKRLHVAYDALVVALQQEAAIELPTLRPTNYTRSLFHVCSAVGSAMLVQHVLSPRGMIWVAGAFTVAGWTMEISRRHSALANRLLMGVFKHVAHEHERHRINSSTWYTTALLLIALTMSPMACTAALLVLGLGDPAAGLVGRRFGRIRLANGKSLEGALAFVAAGALAAGVALALYYPTLSPLSVLILALASAVAGALAELFFTRVDDNFSIPLAAGAGCSLAAALLALS